MSHVPVREMGLHTYMNTYVTHQPFPSVTDGLLNRIELKWIENCTVTLEHLILDT